MLLYSIHIDKFNLLDVNKTVIINTSQQTEKQNMNKIYTVNGIKTFRGHDGYGYNCNILKNGKKVAEVLEDGWGGGLQIRWLDNTAPAPVINRSYDDKEITFEGTVEQALFYAEVMNLPKLPEHDGFPEMNTSADIVIDEMVNETLAIKKLLASMKKSVTVQCNDGKLLTWKITPTHTEPVLRSLVMKKHPDAKIMNDLPIEEVFQIYKEADLVG